MIDESSQQVATAGRAVPLVLESREHLEAILNGVADGVVVQDIDGNIAYANGSAAQLLGFSTPADMLGRTIHNALASFELRDTSGPAISTEQLPAREIFTGALSARRAIVVQHRESGEERWWIVTASPVRDVVGNVAYAVCILRDATDRVRGGQANARLAAIVASSADAIIGKNLDAVITNWNPAAERLYGYSAAEAVGQSIAMLIPPDRPDELPSIMARLRKGQHIDTIETVRMHKDGTRVDVSLSFAPIRNEDNQIVGASTIARDITAQRRSQNALKLLAEAGDVLGASLDYETTLAGLARLLVPRLADWSAVNMLDETGLPAQIALAHSDPDKVEWVRKLQEQFRPSPDEVRAMLQVLSTGEPQIYREITDEFLVANARSPEHLDVLRQLGFRSALGIPMMARGRVIGTISLVYAESGRIYHDDEIQLAQEIARRAALAVDNAMLFAEAQQAARAREAFLLTASHELRTPLTSVKASAHLVSRYLHQPEPDQARIIAMVDRLRGEIGRLETLSLDLLDAARIQRGRFELHAGPCDLVAIAREVVATLEQSAYRQPAHHLIVDVDEPVTGDWDEHRLRQVISNLVSNALKYSPEGGDVRVGVRRDGDDAILTVEDTGIGIDPADAARLFQPFERAENTHNAIGGVGLGLYISRQIVDAHGGSIVIESKLGTGSCFTVRLPLNPPLHIAS